MGLFRTYETLNPGEWDQARDNSERLRWESQQTTVGLARHLERSLPPVAGGSFDVYTGDALDEVPSETQPAPKQLFEEVLKLDYDYGMDRELRDRAQRIKDESWQAVKDSISGTRRLKWTKLGRMIFGSGSMSL